VFRAAPRAERRPPRRFNPAAAAPRRQRAVHARRRAHGTGARNIVTGDKARKLMTIRKPSSSSFHEKCNRFPVNLRLKRIHRARLLPSSLFHRAPFNPITREMMTLRDTRLSERELTPRKPRTIHLSGLKTTPQALPRPVAGGNTTHAQRRAARCHLMTFKSGSEVL
jgi:hypothetical protein